MIPPVRSGTGQWWGPKQGWLFHIFSLLAFPDGAKAETVEKPSDKQGRNQPSLFIRLESN